MYHEFLLPAPACLADWLTDRLTGSLSYASFSTVQSNMSSIDWGNYTPLLGQRKTTVDDSGGSTQKVTNDRPSSDSVTVTPPSSFVTAVMSLTLHGGHLSLQHEGKPDPDGIGGSDWLRLGNEDETVRESAIVQCEVCKF